MSAGSIRVDKFVVPEHAREEFLDRVHLTHAALGAQPGFVRDATLEQSSGPGEFDFVPIVEWQNGDAVEGAHKAVVAIDRRMILTPGR
jgi:hypothetical protein